MAVLHVYVMSGALNNEKYFFTSKLHLVGKYVES